MSAAKSGSSLRTLLLTPQRVPAFLIPSRSPLLCLSPRLRRSSSDRTRLLSDDEDDSPGALSPAAPRRSLLRLPSPRPRHPRHAVAAAESADTDLTTRAAMSLPHVEKVITPYGFRAALAASPCTRRRESLFHQSKPLTVTDGQQEEPAEPPPPPGRSHVLCAVMKELKRPAAALKALSPATRRTRPR
uniref:C2 calcium-dependent domain-containing protein 4C-like n=1 Tax=Scatophagus argus TaxID=75038 RepID=UPI001ED7F59E|nr:C2 calcium-dependent domain-containing protein 4C-like [Scatophagus argus]